MPRIKDRSTRLVNDREERFERAIKAIKAGIHHSIGEAAVAFDLPKSSLAHRLNGRQSRQKSHEGDQVISPAAEKAIVKWILKLDEYGFPPRLDRLWEKVETIAVAEREALHARYDTEGRRNRRYDHIGRSWITHFLNRHPELCSKLATRMDRQRVYANNPIIIQDHFRKLGKLICDEQIKPYAITNMDEKGIILGFSTKTKVITLKGKKTPYVRQDGTREMVTLIEAVTASGYIFPTFLITKGKQHTYGEFGNLRKEDSDIRFAKSTKGWTDDKFGYEWLCQVYEPYSRQWISGDEKRLLILDGHVSHVNLKFITFCIEHNIFVFCLPPHSTHLLQPLDVLQLRVGSVEGGLLRLRLLLSVLSSIPPLLLLL